MAALGVLKAFTASALVFLAATALSARAAHDEDEPLLRGPEGPYRGTVVDAKTDRPIPDAAVVIIWQKPDDRFEGRRLRAAVHETLTDGTGRFVLDVAQIEARLLPRAFPPRILIYRPGYTALPPETHHPAGVPARPFTGAGVTVRLTPLTDPEDRAEAFNAIFGSDLMPSSAPLVWELLKFELENFGYKGPPEPVFPK